MTDNLFDHIDDVEPATMSGFGPLDRVMLYSPDGSNAYVLQHLGNQPIFAVTPTDHVRVINAAGGVTECTWADIADNPRFWLQREARIVASDPELLLDQLPFSADGLAWCSTQGDEVFGEGDWEIMANGEPMSFDLQSLDVRYAEPATNVRTGTWVEVTCAGVSMSTGDIGWTLWMDDHGGLWSYQWGCYHDYLGRESATDLVRLVTELVARLKPMVYDIVAIRSEVFSLEELKPAITWLIENDDSPTDSVEVGCTDFDGTWDEVTQQ